MHTTQCFPDKDYMRKGNADMDGWVDGWTQKYRKRD